MDVVMNTESTPHSGSWTEDIKTARRLLLGYSTEDATAQEGDAALRRLEEQLEAVEIRLERVTAEANTLSEQLEAVRWERNEHERSAARLELEKHELQEQLVAMERERNEYHENNELLRERARSTQEQLETLQRKLVKTRAEAEEYRELWQEAEGRL